MGRGNPNRTDGSEADRTGHDAGLRDWKHFLPEARVRVRSSRARYGGAHGMALARKDALKRLGGLERQVETHLQKISENPTSESVAHWKAEVRAWIEQIERLLSSVGEKTAADWAARIAVWKAVLGG